MFSKSFQNALLRQSSLTPYIFLRITYYYPSLIHSTNTYCTYYVAVSAVDTGTHQGIKQKSCPCGTDILTRKDLITNMIIIIHLVCQKVIIPQEQKMWKQIMGTLPSEVQLSQIQNRILCFVIQSMFLQFLQVGITQGPQQKPHRVIRMKRRTNILNATGMEIKI